MILIGSENIVDDALTGGLTGYKRMLENFWAGQVKFITEAEVLDMLRSGKISRGVSGLIANGTGVFANGKFADQFRGDIYAAGRSMSKTIGDRVGKNISYTATAATEQYIRNEAAELAAGLTVRQRDAIKAALKFAVENKQSVADAAKSIRVNLPLTGRETASTLTAYRKAYDAEYERAKAANRTTREAERRATIAGNAAMKKKAEYMSDVRAVRIASTEIPRAVSHGTIAALSEAKRAGDIAGAWKLWVRTNYRDNWESSIANDKAIVDIDAPFPMPTAGSAYFPAEIQEKCRLQYFIEEF